MVKHSAREAVLVDVDGTLCDNSDIIYLLVDGTQRDYERYHTESLQCPANPDTVEWVDQHRDEGRAILIVTARRRRWEKLTATWLRERDFAHDGMFMRDDHDERPDDRVKLDILNGIREQYKIVAAIDDHPHVAALWEREKIPTTVVPGWIG